MPCLFFLSVLLPPIKGAGGGSKPPREVRGKTGNKAGRQNVPLETVTIDRMAVITPEEAQKVIDDDKQANDDAKSATSNSHDEFVKATGERLFGEFKDFARVRFGTAPKNRF